MQERTNTVALTTNIGAKSSTTSRSAQLPPKPKMAMVDVNTGETLEVVTELTSSEEKQRHDLMQKMKAYAKRYLSKHPNTKPERLKRIVSKKFNVQLT